MEAMEWTIGELAERATTLLGPTAQLSGRVRDAPNERLIRWYATIGLLDPPLTRRGRVALYGRRHLLQLVAVKRRQAEGRTIAEIQAELAGATDRTLEAIAEIPEPPAAPPVPPRPARPRFWAEPPAATGAGATPPPSPAAPPGAPPGIPRSPTGRPPVTAPAPPPRPATPGTAGRSLRRAPHPAGARPAPLPEAGPPPSPPAAARPPAPDAPAGPSTAPGPRAPAPPPGGPQAVAVHGVRLAPGVTLLLDGGRAPSPDDLTAIGAASRALLAVLREHDLVPPEGEQS
ncbi:MerR family transcriptional regulator [Streptosporangium sp. NPDC048047]|uniref:MerR family transcriptional regulator n=1 Tax=Streptosporangium sp. NPDC048047 TaxID=3155748 RepID=UPI003425C87B